jgi:hypothetical protein
MHGETAKQKNEIYDICFKIQPLCSVNTHGLPHRPKPQPVNDVHGVVPWLRWLDAGLSSKTLGFDPGVPYVGFAVDKLTLGPAFSEHIDFPSSSIIPPLLHAHLPLCVALTRRSNGRSWNIQANSGVSEIGAHRRVMFKSRFAVYCKNHTKNI